MLIGAPSLPSFPPSSIQASTSQTRKAIRLVQHQEIHYTAIHPVAELLKGLVTEFLKLAKDGSLFFKFHRDMRTVTREHEHVEALQVQLLLFKKVVNFSSGFIADVQKDSAQSEKASKCRQDAVSILMDAEANIAMIKGFLAQGGHVPPITYVV